MLLLVGANASQPNINLKWMKIGSMGYAEKETVIYHSTSSTR